MQTSVEFKRIKGQSGAEAVDVVDHHHGLSSQAANINHKEATSKGSGNASPECFSTDSDTETDTVLHKLMTELEEERKRSQRASAELAEEMEKNQHVLLLLEEEKQGREEERKAKDAQLENLQSQLSQVQTQCLEIQQYKEEKEKLNREVLELRKKLQEEEDAEVRRSEAVASSARRLQTFEEEKLRQEEEMRRLKGEVERVRQLLDESEKELKRREEEVEGLKASKNRQNQAKAGFSSERISINEGNRERGLDQESLNTSLLGDILMERYLSSAPLEHSHSSLINESFEHCSQLEISTELLKQKVSMEEQQTRQISLIKQVTEREHERMISELAAKHNEELDQLRTEVSLELRESMEAAHQAELQQAQAQKTLELEALRLSLTTVHVSQLEDHQVQQEQESALGKVQDSVKERVAQDLLLLEARHQSDLDQIKQRSREQQDRLLELHKQELGECRQRVLLGLLSVFMTAGFFSVHSTCGALWALKEQLLARSAQVDDIERLKTEFNEQKRELKERNEAELEDLRSYFEKRLQASEESYKEEVALLQLRLVESALEDSVLQTTDDKYGSWSSHDVFIWYSLQMSLISFASSASSLAYQVRSDLTDRYYKELQEMKTRHALELEQLRAKLSSSHLKGKYEKSVEELKAKHEAELERERTALLNKHSKEMDEVDAKHRAQLESLSASHRDQLAAMTDELESKHNAELVALEASLKSKQKEDRESLEAAYQETNRAQLEALEADLARKHQEDRDELERRMLGNMDTLETTYLKEVQALRDEIVQLEERHRQDLLRQSAEHKRLTERQAAEQASVRDELRKELAQVHVEKFRAMAAELSHVHKVTTRRLHQTNDVSELKGTSARELEACRRELEESSSRQRQHFLEEVELLKVQSEEQLQDRINQLKVKNASRVDFNLLLISFFCPPSQLRAEVGCLQGELQGKSAEMETMDTLLQRRERETQEGGNLLKMLTDDLQAAKEDSLLVSDSQLRPGGEESALNACDRLRHTVDTLLELLNQANTQLEQARGVHLSLEEKFSRGREDTTQLVEQHKLLMKQLDQEAKKNTQLQLELHKAEGLLDGYVAEKAALEESLQQKENQEEKLVEELEAKYQDLSEEHTLLLPLLAETERLTQEKLDLQRQAEKDHSSLSQRLRTLERELEDQETKDLEKELHHKTHTEDLGQRVQALEKQLKHDRQFIEEQAVEREHERDEFQQEIRRLEAQLKQTANVDNKGHRVRAVESLQTNLKDKIEAHASLLAANQQAQRDLGERNEEIDKLAGRIRELEQALLNSAESVRTVSHLEEELHKAKLREQELTQDKLALEQQQLSSRLQISALQSKLDETRHCYHDNTRDPTEELREALDAAQQSLHSKEQENSQRDLSIKEAELKHLTLQLELLTNKNAAHVQELQEQISEKVSALTVIDEEKEEHAQVEETEEQTLPAALLQEKNQEIDHLNCEIQRLEQELENARNDKVLEVELEDLRSKVEHLQSEISRVRHEKQEEEERLHEVISTLQAELATLGPNVHEVSDSQDGDSINPSPAPSPEPQQYHQEQERRGKPKSLKHEISLTNSAASSSLRARLKALQSQFETAVAEKEGLERLLLTQEEEYRGQGEEFGKRLKAEREKSDEVQGLLTLKEAELKEAKAIAEEEREKKKLSEEERDLWKVQAGEANTLREEKAHLNALILDLQKNEQDQRREIENLTTKEQEMTRDMEALRKNGLSLERQVQEMRAEKVDMEELVNEGREQMKTLKTVKGELSAEREALRRRESQLQEEIQRLRQEATSMKALIQDLTFKLHEKETNQEEAQKEVLKQTKTEILVFFSLTIKRMNICNINKRSEDTQKLLEDERQRFARQQELSSQEKTCVERLLREAESRLAEFHSKLADSHRKLDEERDRWSRQADELGRRHEADAARDGKFISDLRSQLEQERRQGEELAAVMDRLRAELLQSRRKWEEEEKTRREQLQREQEAATRQRVALETLKEQKQEITRAFEGERERSKRQGVELAELKERLRILKEKERERDEKIERERKKERQEQMEREARQERTNNKLVSYHLLSGCTCITDIWDDCGKMQRQITTFPSPQSASTSSSNTLEALLRKNSELTEQNELARVTAEMENRPVDDASSNSRLQRYYERYLRAESFRKALVYQKRYLLLLLGGFQDCEQATLCLIARMGARPSTPLASQHKPLGRFRATVRVVIAVSALRLSCVNHLTACERVGFLFFYTLVSSAGCKAEVLRQQQAVSGKSKPFFNEFSYLLRPSSSSSLASARCSGTAQDPERSLTEYIHHLEKVQQRLVGARQGEQSENINKRTSFPLFL
uniref:Pericentrin n=1 Tax=Kryptolebias marmoratus TaxID=37003 RepID=A0A3Q3AKB8_KRYMA